jgi:hypothetical protein
MRSALDIMTGVFCVGRIGIFWSVFRVLSSVCTLVSGSARVSDPAVCWTEGLRWAWGDGRPSVGQVARSGDLATTSLSDNRLRSAVFFLRSCPPYNPRILDGTIWLSRATHHPPPATPYHGLLMIAPR